MDAPEVDAKPSDQLWVQITHADEHDVWGVRVED
jgi:ribosomal protein S12 methylthiotransferase